MSGAQQSPDAKWPHPAPASTTRRTPLAGLVGILTVSFWPLTPALAGLQCPAGSLPQEVDGALPALQRITDGTGITKFSLIARHCADLSPDRDLAEGLPAAPSGASAAPTPSTDAAAAASAYPAHRAAQLDLYERGAASPNIRFIDGMAAATVATPAATPGASRSPHGGHRMTRLAPAMSLAGAQWDIDPLLLHAIAHVESRHNPGAISHAGARGLMQVMPQTARRFGMADPKTELMDADANVAVSSAYLKTLQKRFGNNLPLVLAAYNAGEGAVEKYGRKIPPYKETQNYVREVLATYQLLRSRAAAPGGSVTEASRASVGQGPL